jgi:hypothetical protein
MWLWTRNHPSSLVPAPFSSGIRGLQHDDRAHPGIAPIYYYLLLIYSSWYYLGCKLSQTLSLFPSSGNMRQLVFCSECLLFARRILTYYILVREGEGQEASLGQTARSCLASLGTMVYSSLLNWKKGHKIQFIWFGCSKSLCSKAVIRFINRYLVSHFVLYWVACYYY